MIDFNNPKINLIAGLGVILLILGFFLNMMLPHASNYNVYRVHFQQVKDLKIGQSVYLSGYPVGFVESLMVTPEDAIGIIALNKDIAIPKDSSFSVVTSNLFTDSKLLFLNMGIDDNTFANQDNIYNTVLALSLADLINMLAGYMGQSDNIGQNKASKPSQTTTQPLGDN